MCSSCAVSTHVLFRLSLSGRWIKQRKVRSFFSWLSLGFLSSQSSLLFSSFLFNFCSDIDFYMPPSLYLFSSVASLFLYLSSLPSPFVPFLRFLFSSSSLSLLLAYLILPCVLFFFSSLPSLPFLPFWSVSLLFLAVLCLLLRFPFYTFSSLP